MSSNNISGGRTAKEIALAYLTSNSNPPAPRNNPNTMPTNNSGNPNPSGNVPNPSNAGRNRGVSAVGPINLGFYEIEKKFIIDNTSQKYRDFLKRVGYADLDAVSSMHVAKNVLKYDQDVRTASTSAGLSFTGNDGQYVVNINQSDGRKLVQSMGGQLLTTALMYKIFIPYLKISSSSDATVTLNEMRDTKAEWLEDLILDGTLGRNLKIGNGQIRKGFQKKDGRFDRGVINEYGYPDKISDTGEFYYWCPRDGDMAAIRDWDSGLFLVLSRVPGVAGGGLGVRAAKFFP